MWASASGRGPPSAGHAEEFHRHVRLCQQGHHWPPTGGAHHQPEKPFAWGIRGLSSRGESESSMPEHRGMFQGTMVALESLLKTPEPHTVNVCSRLSLTDLQTSVRVTKVQHTSQSDISSQLAVSAITHTQVSMKKQSLVWPQQMSI